MQTTFGQLPSMQLALRKLQLVEQLREQANIDTVLGFSIVKAINANNKSDTKILETVKQCAIDNPEAMSIVIGESLCQDILNLNL